MIELKLSREIMGIAKKHEKKVVVPQDETDLLDLGGSISDEIGAGPPVSIQRDDLPSTIEELRAENIEPLVLIWSTDLGSDNKEMELEPLVTLDHYDERYIFGSPTLSFLSRTGPFWDSIPKKPRAVYDARYSTIAQEYLEGLRRSGYEISSMPVKGDIGQYFRNGMADIGIGLVSDEDLIAESGTWPLDRIMKGEPVLARIRAGTWQLLS